MLSLSKREGDTSNVSNRGKRDRSLNRMLDRMLESNTLARARNI